MASEHKGDTSTASFVGLPTVTSQLRTTGNVWVELCAALLFLGIGAALVLNAWTVRDQISLSLFLVILGILLLIFGSWFLHWTIRKDRTPFSISHAPDGTLPEVPRRPHLVDQPLALGLYHMEFSSDGFQLTPPRLYPRWFCWISMPFAIGVLSGLGKIWWPWFVDGRNTFEIIAESIVLIVITGSLWMIIGILIELFDKSQKSLELRIERGEVRIRSGDRRIAFPARQAVAVQICAAYCLYQEDEAVSTHKFHELNLVWDLEGREGGAAAGVNQELHRCTIVDVGESRFHRDLGLMASFLAETLRIPILFHATEKDWELERYRYKSRPVRRQEPIRT